MDFSNPLVFLLSIAALLAIVALLILLIVFLVRPSSRRDAFRIAVPLYLRGGRNKKHHVFLGISEHSKLMAAQILQELKQQQKKKDRGSILFVNLAPSFINTAERKLREELGSDKITVLSGMPPQPNEHSLARAIGLEKLQPWLSNPRTSLYLFSDKREENSVMLSISTDDSTIKAKVFYYTPEPGGFESLLTVMGARIRALNPHQMSFMQLKLNAPQLLPVHFVKRADNADGTSLGYVEDGLHALVVGFGSSGQEAVRFLYEYGSFVGKDRRRAPMSISVYDPQMESKLGSFLQAAPALKGDPVFQWHAQSAGSVSFWEDFEKDQTVNYIIIAMDDGPANLQLGISMLQTAARIGRDLSKMVILVRYWKESRKSREIISFYNAAYCPEGAEVLHGFGNTRDIWNTDVISGKKLKKAAQSFYENQEASGEDETWEERKKRLSQPGADHLKNRMELQRRQAADISRALYAPTLQVLIPDGKEESLKGYRAAQEQLHAACTLVIDGYTPGPADELCKRLPDLVLPQE